MDTDYAKELSELIPLLTNLWLAPSVYPASANEVMRKFTCVCTMLEVMGVSLLDDEIKKMAEHHFKEIATAD